MTSAMSNSGSVPITRGQTILRWVFVVVLIGVMVQGVALLHRLEPNRLPVRVIAIDGEVHRHSLPVLQETVADRLDGGLVMVDLRGIKAAVEDLPWVAAVSLRRVWPERLELTVIEHRPIARWGDDGLVTADGVVFRPDPATIPPGLPRLAGDERAAPHVVARYREWRDRLAPLGLVVTAVEQDARDAWRLRLRDGAELVLGTRYLDERIARFIQAYPSLRLVGHARVVDLRYSNGLAVRWAEGSGTSRPAAVSVEHGYIKGRS
ncbi:cell division protein FtsQ/DivIB [Thioalkalicoccus limnaeus]|uniref:Cell division protein FtsQ n=1 Tax=Thioalkalicoccus limnaeus TaxID=120681 RepID=A0ABV4BB74_9GAMM